MNRRSVIHLHQRALLCAEGRITVRRGHVGSGATLLLGALALAVFMAPWQALAQTYALRVEPINYEAMPSGGFPGGEKPIELHSSSFSDTSVKVEIPWNFNFYGTPYREMHVHAAGAVTFGDPPPVLGDTPKPVAIPDPEAPNNMIALWWWRLLCNSGNNSGIVRSQVVGTPPNRKLVVEWPNCRAWSVTTTAFKFQLWLSEGSDDIEVHYGPDPGSDSPGTYKVYAAVGVENATGTDGTAFCDGLCETVDFPEGMALIYSPGAQVRIGNFQGPDEGYAGIPFPIEYTMTNPGSKPAEDFTVQYWVSPEPTLGSRAISLGYDGRTWSLDARHSLRVNAEPRLPIALDEGEYYLIVEADPHHVVDISNRAGTIGVYGPFKLGIRAADLTAPWVFLPDLVHPGEVFTVRWLAQNRGNLIAKDFSYRVALSREPFPSPAAPVLVEQSLDALPMDSETLVETTVQLPAEIEPGIYYALVELNPDRKVFEHVYGNNVGISQPVVVSGEDLVILTENLPLGHIHGHYSLRLLAAGGDGIHRWTVEEGSLLPPGMQLRERESTNGGFATFLEGSPTTVGSFAFTLRVESGGFSQTREYVLEVSNAEHELTIATEVLAGAAFGLDYRDELLAIGGVPPYTWELHRANALPLGIQLRSDGILSGRPQQDGPFPITFRVSDSEGRQATKDFILDVAPPSTLTCVTRELPPLTIDEFVEIPLLAAGGRKRADNTYLWSSVSLERMAEEAGESSGRLEGDIGLQLDPAGVIREAPKVFGTFLWTLEVRDDTMGEGVKCPVIVRVPRDRGLTVVTKRLPAAIAGRSYRARLEASGGEGDLRWEEFGSGRLLEELGLRFDASGDLHGTPSIDMLEGEEEKDFTITFRVEDEKSRIGLGVVNITLRASPVQSKAGGSGDEGGCQTGGGTPTAWMIALLGLALLRRRR